jgi:ribulose-phosphate 3-epimerase
MNKPVVCPTVTAFSASEYQQQLSNIQGFAKRIHIDFMDGILAPTVSVSIKDAWWQPGPVVDLHVMYQKPLEQLENLVALHPDMIIIHAEAESALEFINELEGLGIKKGIALLKDTKVEDVSSLLPLVDHVLIFSGDLGHFGGTVDLSLLKKAEEIKNNFPNIELGWDGGINSENVMALVSGGINVLNVGGFIQMAEDPEAAYDKIVMKLREGQ